MPIKYTRSFAREWMSERLTNRARVSNRKLKTMHVYHTIHLLLRHFLQRNFFLGVINWPQKAAFPASISGSIRFVLGGMVPWGKWIMPCLWNGNQASTDIDVRIRRNTHVVVMAYGIQMGSSAALAAFHIHTRKSGLLCILLNWLSRRILCVLRSLLKKVIGYIVKKELQTESVCGLPCSTKEPW